jgi:hypothetical protein
MKSLSSSIKALLDVGFTRRLVDWVVPVPEKLG